MATTKKPKIKKIKSTGILPTITRGKKPESGEYPIKKVSQSKLVKFSTNPIMFRINYINGDRIDTANSIGSVVGNGFHAGMKVYNGGSDEHIALNESEAIEFALKVGTKYLDDFNDGFINYAAKTPNKQKAIEHVVSLLQSYIAEHSYNQKIISTEEYIEEYIDVEWRGQQISLPIKLEGYIDKLFEENINGVDELVIEDYKTSIDRYSDGSKMSGAKMLQAVEYFFLVYAKYGRAPHSIIFSEVKAIKNTDGSPQTRPYRFIFAENDYFFDFYLRLYFDMIRCVNGQAVYVPNVNAYYDCDIAIMAYILRLDEPDEVARKMQEMGVKTMTELISKEMQNAKSLRTFVETASIELQTYKSLDYEKMTIQERIQNKLMEHGILVGYENAITGHSVTLYRFAPHMGVKMKEIESRIKDVEQAIGVAGVRVLAPIPNTSLIGIEVPNAERTFVNDVPKPQGFKIAIGVDIAGNIIYSDFRDWPHLLVAGASGSGKSVSLNSLIGQFVQIPNIELYLFDPKIVELAQFENAPRVKQYLTEPEEISVSLAKLVKDMNGRYKKLRDAGVRNIADYNGKMAYRIVVVDEFGDLVKGGRGDGIDDLILLLAQKGRAAGIHIILATQRPSVDIISGVIKANFPTKIAFKMAKAIDSQVLLDEAGAEKLLGKGDMLFQSDAGIFRLQGFNA